MRGFDLANITFIAGKTGWIVIDPLTRPRRPRRPGSRQREAGQRPVVAVIYSHSHADHYGGVRGIVDQADVTAGKVQDHRAGGFMEHAVSENVIAGNAMSRRAIYSSARCCRATRRAASTAASVKPRRPGPQTLIPPTRHHHADRRDADHRRRAHEFQMTPAPRRRPR